jgi:hypothetical protein
LLRFIDEAKLRYPYSEKVNIVQTRGEGASQSTRPIMCQRIAPIDLEIADAPVKAVLQAQQKRWGAPLLPHAVHARRPSIFKGVQAMWSGLASSGLLAPELHNLVNRRVALLNKCPF